MSLPGELNWHLGETALIVQKCEGRNRRRPFILRVRVAVGVTAVVSVHRDRNHAQNR
jgi:hypothetical protein